jgi:hypothetical protein
MRLALPALFLLLVLTAPIALAGPPRVESVSAGLVTPVKPYTVGLLVPQDGKVTLLARVQQGAYDGLSLQVDDACGSVEGPGASFETPDTEPALPGSHQGATMTVPCGTMKAGWYILKVSVDRGAARVVLEASGATLH